MLKYEIENNIQLNHKKFPFMMYDQDAGIGVINAYTVYKEIYIDDISIEQKHHQKGYGRQLLVALEDMFKGKGFDNMNLYTSQFQAPEFYLKCSFKLEFIRHNDSNPKLNKFFFCKKFNDSS